MWQSRWIVSAVAAILAMTGALFAQDKTPPQQPYYTPPATGAEYAQPAAPVNGAACQGSLWDHLRPWFQWTHWGYPEEFKAVPLGARTQCLLRAQVCNGMVMQLTLYRFDFVEETAAKSDTLTPLGRRRLAYMLAMVEKYQAHPIVIESTGNGALDAARRQHVLAAITAEGLTMPSDWVISADPASINLRGGEAMLNYANMLKRTKAEGKDSGTSGDQNVLMLNMPQPGGSPSGQGSAGSGGQY